MLLTEGRSEAIAADKITFDARVLSVVVLGRLDAVEELGSFHRAPAGKRLVLPCTDEGEFWHVGVRKTRTDPARPVPSPPGSPAFPNESSRAQHPPSFARDSSSPW